MAEEGTRAPDNLSSYHVEWRTLAQLREKIESARCQALLAEEAPLWNGYARARRIECLVAVTFLVIVTFLIGFAVGYNVR